MALHTSPDICTRVSFPFSLCRLRLLLLSERAQEHLCSILLCRIYTTTCRVPTTCQNFSGFEGRGCNISHRSPDSCGVYSIIILPWWFFSYFFFNDFIYLFLENGEKEGKREGKKHRCVVASHRTPAGGLAPNPGMSPDWESNHWPLGSHTGSQSTEPHQPGWFFLTLINYNLLHH